VLPWQPAQRLYNLFVLIEVIDPVASRCSAYDALLHYLFKKNIIDDRTIQKNIDTFVVSLLTDMRYLCQDRNIDFDAVVEASAKRYSEQASSF
jgi:hypothetical protein